LQSVSHLLADPGFWPWLFIVGFLLLVGWSLWPTHDEPKPEGGSTITTGGPNSPGFGTVHGNVTQVFHPPPSVTQPVKPPYGGRNQRSLDGLMRVMSGHNRLARSEKRRREEDERCPEMPIWQAVEHVRRVIGDDDSSASYPDARSQIRQAALEGRLIVWGRHEIPPEHLTAELKARSVWSKIEPDYWHNYELNRLATVDRFDDREHTWNEAFKQEIGNRYWSLRVRKKAVKRLWPEPVRTTNEGRP
jgi:hypothetical protein